MAEEALQAKLRELEHDLEVSNALRVLERSNGANHVQEGDITRKGYE